MKKLMIVAVMSLGSLSAFAQEEQATEAVAVATEEVQAVEAVAPETQDGFSIVALEELPAAITEAVAKDYPGATISKAYVNEATQYKLEVTQEDGAAVELYADAEGNWIDM